MAVNGLPEGFVLKPATQGLPEGFVLNTNGAGNDGINRPDVSDIPGNVDNQPLDKGLTAASFAEPAATVLSGAIAEPIAGLSGIASEAARAVGFDAPTGPEAIESVREAMTYQPRTEEGQAGLAATGEFLAPVGEAITSTEDFLGDSVFEITDSPALAAIAKSLPTAVLEAIGLKGGGKIAKGLDATPSQGNINKAISASAPSIDTLKDSARTLYKELGDSGVTVKQPAMQRLASNAAARTREAGLDPRVTPKASGALEAIQESSRGVQPLAEIDTLRKIAQNAADSIEGAEKNLGRILIAEIDDFLDTLPQSSINQGALKAEQIGKRYKAARNLWGKAKRSDLIDEAITAAQGRASGMENGLRIELGKLIKNKRTKKYFPKAETAAIRAVVEGDVSQNLAKLIGRFGFSEGRATNVLSALGGIAGGGALGGGFGAVAVPVAGTMARNLAKRLTRNKSEFLGAMTRAGSNADAITKAYKMLPADAQNAVDLAELFIGQGVNVDNLLGVGDQLIREAAEIAAKKQRAGQLAGSLAAGTPQEAVQ